MEKKVALLEAHQKEVHDSLTSMEGLALRMYQVGPATRNGISAQLGIAAWSIGSDSAE